MPDLQQAFTLIVLANLLLMAACGPGAAAGAPRAASTAAATSLAEDRSGAENMTPSPLLRPADAPGVRSVKACPITTPIQDQPAKDPNADPFGFGYWYINADRTLWAGPLEENYPWRAGGNKVMWIRPRGTQLIIAGRRLDAEAPPLTAWIPDGYRTGFQVTGMTFPTEGCWEITARSGDHELRFVTKVAPSDQSLARGDCESFANLVKFSDFIVIGTVDNTDTDGRSYAWQHVRVDRNWKLPPDWSTFGDSFDLLQDLRAQPLLEKGHRYVFFIQYVEPWRIFCPQHSLSEVLGDQVVPVTGSPLWSSQTLKDLRAEIDGLMSRH